MGPSHHALEDYGVLLGLQHIQVFVPAFASDLAEIIPKLSSLPRPAYLRLGRCEKPEGFDGAAYAPWRRLLSGQGLIILAIGPLVGGLLAPLLALDQESRPEVWVLSELPLEANPVPLAFLSALERAERLCVLEEHVAHGGVGQMIAHFLLTQGVSIAEFHHVCARGYPSGNYGSQDFHRKECGLDPSSVIQRIQSLCKKQ